MFLALRSAYTASLAAVSATGYCAGVGDRHLGNIMLHESGRLVPIDFGYARIPTRCAKPPIPAKALHLPIPFRSRRPPPSDVSRDRSLEARWGSDRWLCSPSRPCLLGTRCVLEHSLTLASKYMSPGFKWLSNCETVHVLKQSYIL